MYLSARKSCGGREMCRWVRVTCDRSEKAKIKFMVSYTQKISRNNVDGYTCIGSKNFQSTF